MWADDDEIFDVPGDTFADDLCTNEGGVAITEVCMAGIGARMAEAVMFAFAIAASFAVVATAGKAQAPAILADVDGDTSIPAAGFVAAALATFKFGGSEGFFAFNVEAGISTAANVTTNNI